MSKLSFNPSDLLQEQFKSNKRAGLSVKQAWEFACNEVHSRIQAEQAQGDKCPEDDEIVTHVHYPYTDSERDGNLERSPLLDDAPER